MSGTYYNLPSISCSNRIPTWPKADKNNICNNLNPNEIYNSLFPCEKDPMIPYPTPEKNKSYKDPPISTLAKQTPTTCARSCNNNSSCNAFSIENKNNTCELYHTNKYIPSNRYENESVNNKISIFQYNSNKNNSDCQSGCTKDNMQAFTAVTPPQAPSGWDDHTGTKLTPKNQYTNPTLDECKKNCIDTATCNSIVFTEHDNSCKLFDTRDNLEISKGYDTYNKQANKCNNILGFNIDDTQLYQNYYKKYKTDGNNYQGAVGDYFCNYNSTVKQCLETKNIACTPNSPQCLGQNQKKKKRVPTDTSGACLPPLCDPNTGQHVKHTIKGIRINEYVFQNCQEKGDPDGFCIDDIYTFDDLGLPIAQNGSNPSSKNFLYTRDFDVKNGWNIINCPTGFIKKDGSPPSGGGLSFKGQYICQSQTKASVHCIPVGNVYKGNQGIPMCQPADYMINVKKAFKTKEQCQKWCGSNPDCVGLTSSTDTSGNLLCNFYKKIPNDNEVEHVGSQLYTRRSDPYIYNPKKELLKKYQIPNNTDYKGWTPNDKKFNAISTYSDACGPFGCCADGITLATDSTGSNCTEFSNGSTLIGDPNNILRNTALGGNNHTVPIESNSGSSYIDYMASHGLTEGFANYSTQSYLIRYIVIFFVIITILLIIYYRLKN
jgi:hypothetical protein